jgi:hypothetical protein
MRRPAWTNESFKSPVQKKQESTTALLVTSVASASRLTPGIQNVGIYHRLDLQLMVVTFTPFT